MRGMEDGVYVRSDGGFSEPWGRLREGAALAVAVAPEAAGNVREALGRRGYAVEAFGRALAARRG